MVVRHHRFALVAVAAVHLAAAGATVYAGVPLATPVVLTLAALVAVVLAVTGAPDAADRRRRRGADRHRLGRLEATGRSVDDVPPV